MANSGKAAAKRPDGRPSLYKPEYVDDVEVFCREGAIDQDIANHYGVHVDTIYEWKKVYPEFSEAIKRGKAKPDREVAGKLIDRAMGAKFTVQKEVKLKSVKYDPKTFKKISEDERVEVVTLLMEAPPDTPAIIFFLKNRRPDLWRDKQEVQHSADKDAPPVFTLKIDNS
jgi:hypothetical protein